MPVKQISLTSSGSAAFSHCDLIQELAPHFNHHQESIEFQLDNNFHFDLSVIALFGAWYQKYGKNKEIHFIGEPQSCHKIQQFGIQYPQFIHQNRFQLASNDFLPLLIVDEQSHFSIYTAIMELVIRHFQLHSTDFLNWPIFELLDNIVNHSGAHGFVCARIFQQRYLEIGFWDNGPGLRKTLMQSMIPIKDDQEAIEKALQRGVRRSSATQGNGLAGTLDIIRLNCGRLNICSGTSSLVIDTHSRHGIPHQDVFGTGIDISLDLSIEVDLSDTFIKRCDLSYLEIVEKQFEENQKRFIVKDECEHTGGRSPARSFRNKILNLLHVAELPIIGLDFSGIEFATSSFLDELLGFLIVDLSFPVFQTRIKIMGMNEKIEKYANVVIGQRLGDLTNKEERP